MAVFSVLQEAFWPTVDAEQRVVEFHAEVERLARERRFQDEPIARLALSTEVCERRIAESGDRLVRRGKWGLGIVLAAIGLWTAIVLAFG